MPQPKKDEEGERGEDLLGALVTSAAKILAPNSLQFDDHEFERAPEDARRAALEAARLVRPGDLIFITTKGFLYSIGRYLTNNAYDHVVIVLNERQVLHVGPPSVRLIRLERLLLPQRQPVVLRTSMTDAERAKFVRSAHQLIGAQYDVTRAYQLILRLSLKHKLNRMPLRALPIDVTNAAWICSDAVIVLLAGCSEQFRRALRRARAETSLDIFCHGGASFTDFMRIREIEPDVLTRVPLPVLDFIANPQTLPFKAYVGEFIDLMARIRTGKLRWHLLQDTFVPRIRAATADIGPREWTLETKAKTLVFVLVLLVVMKRGVKVSRVLVRAAQLLLLRQVLRQLLVHVKLEDVARSMLARL